MALLTLRDKAYVPIWGLFIVFASANVFLSYGDLSYAIKGWIFFVGVLVPFLIGLWDRNFEKEDLFQKETMIFSPGRFFWSIAVIVALFLRTYRLTSFHLWPTGDEGLHGFLAISLVDHWKWQFFYTVGEHPPLLIWALAPFFEFFRSPFFDLWFLPAIFSILAVPMGYWACRQFFSKSLSGFFGCLFAFSFWPLFFGRFCHQGLFTPFWEMTGLVFLGQMFRASNLSKRVLWAFGLGLWIGLGSLTFTAWAVVIVLSVIALAVYGWSYRETELKPVSGFFVGLFLGVLPFLIAAFHEGYGHHLIDTSSASHWFDSTHQWVTHLSYITCLFWGSLQLGSSYAPTWGGVLNPLLASCFFIGLLELIHKRHEKQCRWVLIALLVLFLPGLLSSDYVEFNRVIQVLPVLLLITALGVQRLSDELPNRKQWVLVPLFLCSFALDMNHLLKPVVEGPSWELKFPRALKNEGYEVYQVLHNQYRQKGPGLVLADFLPLSHGHMLHVMTYHFNAAINPDLDPNEAIWAAVVVNEDYQKPLRKLFPDAVWTLVTSETPEMGNTWVGVIPITPKNNSVIQHWLKVHRYFYGLNLQAENMYNNPKLYQEALQGFAKGYPLMKEDKFLESCFGEWTTQFHWGGDYRMNTKLMQRTLQKGYPCAHLYFKLGQFYLFDHQLADAQKAFHKALECHPNGTAAGDWLAAITPPKGQK